MRALLIIEELKKLLPLMEKVYDMTWRKQINGEQVCNDEKLFSIYEQHTDIIVKGQREVKFGHKINLASGKSNLILSCEVLKGNPSDSKLYQNTIDKIVNDYKIVPRDSVTDGGYASKENSEYAQGKGIVNIVFNKIVGSLKNITSSRSMETRLKKWRSGIEAVISNLKRGYKLFRCNWKGEAHFKQKILWSVLAYNIRVMTAAVVAKL
ncbi:transposase, IS5 family [Chitinophaga costaii]|uniref:Transposase, IS5 family n=1 Tax=Chitinophaga costaii TaxID=1335309 RepID=A0A1C4EVB0_9BACT|nr:transposase, IS5 family [Chitinophaga costaii]